MKRKTSPKTSPNSLRVISEKVQSLSERLALGRLDGLVLLSANLLTFLMGALATWLPPVLERATDFPALWFSGLGWGIVICVGGAVFAYAIGYLRDDIRQRLYGLLMLLFALGLLTLDVYVWFGAAFIAKPSIECRLPLRGFSLFFSMALLSMPGLFFLGSSIANRLINEFKGWLRKNMPLRWSIEEKNYRFSQAFVMIDSFTSPRWLSAASLSLIALVGLTSWFLTYGLVSGCFDSKESGVLLIFIIVLLTFVPKSLTLAFKGR